MKDKCENCGASTDDLGVCCAECRQALCGDEINAVTGEAEANG